MCVSSRLIPGPPLVAMTLIHPINPNVCMSAQLRLSCMYFTLHNMHAFAEQIQPETTPTTTSRGAPLTLTFVVNHSALCQYTLDTDLPLSLGHITSIGC